MSIRLVHPDKQITIQNPIRGDTIEAKLPNIRGRAAGGKAYVYQKGFKITTYKMSFENLREVEKEALEDFYFSSAINGASGIFTLIDHLNHSYNVQFINDSLNFVRDDDYKVNEEQVTVDGCTFPSTIRDEAVYSIDLEFEVLA